MTHCHYRHRESRRSGASRARPVQPGRPGAHRAGPREAVVLSPVTAEGGPCEVNSGGQGLAAVGVGGPFLPTEAEKPFSPRDGH